MAIVPPQGGILGPYGPNAPQPVPVGATTINTTNPNAFAVNVTPTNSVSNATITSVSVQNVQIATAGGIAVTVPPGGTIKCTYASGTTTYATTGGAATINPQVYPFTDAVFQSYTAQQNLNYGVGTGPGGGPIVQEDSVTAPAEPTNAAGKPLNKDGSVSKRRTRVKKDT